MNTEIWDMPFYWIIGLLRADAVCLIFDSRIQITHKHAKLVTKLFFLISSLLPTDSDVSDTGNVQPPFTAF